MKAVTVPPDVLGYRPDLDSPDIDPDPDFRRALRVLNSIPGAKTVSSCQGHHPGQQYPDVQETMEPYVTVCGDPVSLRYIQSAVAKCPHILSAEGEPPKVLIKFSRSAIGSWRSIADYLTKKSVAFGYG